MRSTNEKQACIYLSSLCSALVLSAGGDWLVEADVREAVPGATIVLPDGTAGGRDWPADPGPGVAVLAVLLSGGAVAVEETLEGEGPVSVVPSEVFAALSGSAGLLAGL